MKLKFALGQVFVGFNHGHKYMRYSISGFIALFIAIIVSRIINEKAFKLLTDEEKLRLMDGFSKSRAYSIIPLLILVGIYFYLVTKISLDSGPITIIYFGMLIVYVVVRVTLTVKKLNQLNMPANYRKLLTVSQAVSLLGFAWLFYSLIQSY